MSNLVAEMLLIAIAISAGILVYAYSAGCWVRCSLKPSVRVLGVENYYLLYLC